MSTLNEYIKNLASSDETERTYAAEDLGYLNIRQAVAPLLDRLPVESSAVVRLAIFQALIRITDDETIAGSIRLLNSEDSQIRNLAVGVLHRKGERSIPFLLEAMRHGNSDTRKLVLDALGGIPAQGTGEIYAAALLDEDPNVVITAVENLGNVRALDFRTPIENLLQPDAHPMLIAACLEALACVGNESSLAAIRRCFPKLTAIPPFLFAPCLKAIAALGGAPEFDELLSLLPAPNPQWYSPVLSSLVKLFDRGIDRRSALPELRQELLAALRSLIVGNQPASCRYQAVRVLGFWAERDDVAESLVSCLSNLDRFVRIGAAEALRSLQRPELQDLLSKYEAQESMTEEVQQALSR